jgi:hypothetical protein
MCLITVSVAPDRDASLFDSSAPVVQALGSLNSNSAVPGACYNELITSNRCVLRAGINMALLLQKQQAVSRCGAQPRVALLRPQPLVQRSRAFRAVNVEATTKAPAQPVKITIQGRRLPVRGPDRSLRAFVYIMGPCGMITEGSRSERARNQHRKQQLLLLLLLHSQQAGDSAARGCNTSLA